MQATQEIRVREEQEAAQKAREEADRLRRAMRELQGERRERAVSRDEAESVVEVRDEVLKVGGDDFARLEREVARRDEELRKA
eukprot:731854-Hanusia_phi.AAC.1